MATIIGCLPTRAIAFIAVFIYAMHATQAIAFEWKPVLTQVRLEGRPFDGCLGVHFMVDNALNALVVVH